MIKIRKYLIKKNDPVVDTSFQDLTVFILFYRHILVVTLTSY